MISPDQGKELSEAEKLGITIDKAINLLRKHPDLTLNRIVKGLNIRFSQQVLEEELERIEPLYIQNQTEYRDKGIIKAEENFVEYYRIKEVIELLMALNLSNNNGD